MDTRHTSYDTFDRSAHLLTARLTTVPTLQATAVGMEHVVPVGHCSQRTTEGRRASLSNHMCMQEIIDCSTLAIAEQDELKAGSGFCHSTFIQSHCHTMPDNWCVPLKTLTSFLVCLYPLAQLWGR